MNIFARGGGAALDIWTQERLSLDFGSQYKITNAFDVYFNAKDLTNTALKFTEGSGPDRVIQREFCGVTLQLGARERVPHGVLFSKIEGSNAGVRACRPRQTKRGC